jgi:transcription termination factor Rho
MADRRIFPAIDIKRSGTRKEDLLLCKEELEIMWNLRKTLNQSTATEAIEFLTDVLRKTKSNRELLLKTVDLIKVV